MWYTGIRTRQTFPLPHLEPLAEKTKWRPLAPCGATRVGPGTDRLKTCQSFPTMLSYTLHHINLTMLEHEVPGTAVVLYRFATRLMSTLGCQSELTISIALHKQPTPVHHAQAWHQHQTTCRTANSRVTSGAKRYNDANGPWIGCGRGVTEFLPSCLGQSRPRIPTWHPCPSGVHSGTKD